MRDPRMGAVCPPEAENLWAVFNEMGCPSGDFAFISQQEIAAWQTNHRIRLTGWELGTLRALDNIAAEIAAKHKKANQ